MKDKIADMHRNNCEANSGAQPLRPGSGMGPVKRIRGHTIVRSISTYLHTQDERWSVLIGPAPQDLKDGSTRTPHIVEQPSSSRPWQPPSIVRPRSYIRRNRFATAFGSCNATISCTPNESASNFPQPALILRITSWAEPQAISLTQSIYDATTCGNALCFTKSIWRTWTRI